eukprot:gene10547-12198_t
MQPAVGYSVIKSGECEDSWLSSIYDDDECRKALEATGYSIAWGPYGGYDDVVDGCSIRFGDNAFRNDKGKCSVGAATPDWIPGLATSCVALLVSTSVPFIHEANPTAMG